ncbi:MAG: benzoyl-CoA 2,3-epoxidase subunit BoxB [Acidobacteriota bacterium]|nr:benzoyl-CoA 2,3-epoxidase subunit BoxB [Blastocatellia bacterium]MDW8239426.1 benzoyl-CoA 2,3-epoxidase subunit BoxB [Acidobacteriota bacterium]
MTVAYEKIPNNVNLAENRRLQRALEQWQPNFLQWWHEVGPAGFQQDEIYLRTAISVSPDGWAHFDYVKMPEYRWGIFVIPPTPDRRIGFGDNLGQPVWHEVPGEFRKELRRIIVTQGDTEPASVEQQRLLGHTAPSLYDLRNLLQVNVEEGRHLWAMVYLLHQYFGRDGRDEAEDMLVRRAGHADNPRILSAFNKPVKDWLAFFCFAMFTDRDGKYQLAALAESAFDPLARSTRFMLTEEAHHLFVGETGIERVVRRTAELMQQDPNQDARAQGAIPLDIIQKYINEWYSASLDLFGGEDSSNAATYFAAGLKGRFRESAPGLYNDHIALEGAYRIDVPDEAGHIRTVDIPLRRAMNQILRDAYVADCQRAMDRWNRILEKNNIEARLSLPSQRFNRQVGIFAGARFSPTGERLSEQQWQARCSEWLPTEADYAYVQSLMKPVYERGQFAHWIAPPARGINGQPLDFEYVRFHRG